MAIEFFYTDTFEIWGDSIPKRLFFYGAGFYGKEVWRVLRTDGKDTLIQAFFVTKKFNCGEMIDGIPIIELAKWPEVSEHISILLCLSPQNCEDVINYLKNQDFSADVYVPTKKAYEDLDIRINKIRMQENDDEVNEYYKRFIDNKTLFRYIEIE